MFSIYTLEYNGVLVGYRAMRLRRVLGISRGLESYDIGVHTGITFSPDELAGRITNLTDVNGHLCSPDELKSRRFSVDISSDGEKLKSVLYNLARVDRLGPSFKYKGIFLALRDIDLNLERIERRPSVVFRFYVLTRDKQSQRNFEGFLREYNRENQSSVSLSDFQYASVWVTNIVDFNFLVRYTNQPIAVLNSPIDLKFSDSETYSKISKEYSRSEANRLAAGVFKLHSPDFTLQFNENLGMQYMPQIRKVHNLFLDNLSSGVFKRINMTDQEYFSLVKEVGFKEDSSTK